MKLYFGIVALLGFLPCVAHADLVMHIDTDTEEVFFSGTAGGDPGGNGLVRWIFGGNQSSQNFFLIGSALSSTGFGINGGNSGVVVKGTQVEIQVDVDSIVPGTLTGTGNRVSYASFSATNKTNLENIIGQNVSLESGSGWGSMSVQSANAAIPEPATLGILALGGIGFFVRRRKR